MGALGDLFGTLLKPLLLALLLIVALGLFSDRPGTAGGGASFACPRWFDDPGINRMICRYHPVRIWNTPVSELVPWTDAALGADDPR